MDNTNQHELAPLLADGLEIAGHDDLSGLDILAALGTAGLKLVRTDQSEGTMAYLTTFIEPDPVPELWKRDNDARSDEDPAR